MNIFKGMIITIFGLVIWYLSSILVSTHLLTLELSGEIPYGPIQSQANDGYSFNATSTNLMQTYPVSRISEFSKQNFESIIINSLSIEDGNNLKIFLPVILSTSEEFQIDPFWMLSIVMVESRFKNSSISHKNALGLMQIQPETAIHLYELMNKQINEDQIEAQLFNAEKNLELGAFYLKKLLHNFRMNFKSATIAYNMGPNRLKNLIEADDLIMDQNEYFLNVSKNYLNFLKQFKLELNSTPLPFEKTFIVKNQGLILDDFILKQMGLYAYIPKTSLNVLADKL